MSQELLKELATMVHDFGTAPTLADMPRRTLADKGIDGPTAAHVIEEVHTPLNLAGLTFTTGSTAFQNIVGITHAEMPNKIKATLKALELAGIARGSRALVTYAPLVNVFSAAALKEYEISWEFLPRSQRDAFLVALCMNRPAVVVGESSFLRASLADSKKLGIAGDVPSGVIVLAAGTPLDLELLPAAEEFGWKVHDLYGAQEFGWLTLDGIPVREDITMVPSVKGGIYEEMVVGGLPTGDSFPVSESGHVCNPAGRIITYRRERTNPENEVYVAATTVEAKATIERAARTILRIKSRVIKVRPDVRLSAPHTVLELVPSIIERGECGDVVATIEGPAKTMMFDTLVKAQTDLQGNAKTDPTWIKRR